ncbi:MAG: DUF3124 domain-containing protein [Mariniphaga sp.]
MKNHIFLFLLFASFFACQNRDTSKPQSINYPSHNYNYVTVDTSLLKYNETDYVPIYSDIYHLDGRQRFLLTATVSIRNISLQDSAYLLTARYNDSYGKLLRFIVERPILLKPLESIEFVIEDKEDKGGAGASFIIDWGSSIYSKQLLIQAVMIGTAGQQGISFTTNAEVISPKEPK